MLFRTETFHWGVNAGNPNDVLDDPVVRFISDHT